MGGPVAVRLGEEVFFDLMALKRADALACGIPADGREDVPLQALELARQLLAEHPCLTLKDLAVNGRDALAAGLEGPAVGTALRSLLDRVAAGELENQREILLGELNKH